MADSQTIGSLVYDLDAPTDKLNKSLDEADKSVGQLGDNVQSTSKTMQSALNKTAIALGVAGAGLTLYAKSATDFTVQFVKDSKDLGREIGVSTQEASRLTAAFQRMGLTADQTRQMFGIFAKQITASTQNSEANRLATEKLNLEIQQTQQRIVATRAEIVKHGDASGALTLKIKELNNTLASQKNQLNQSADAFAKLGISTIDSQGKQKDFNTLLFEVADKFKVMPDGIDKTTVALQLFGRSGKDMIKVLNLGSEGIRELEKEADRLGLTLTPGTIAKVQKYIESQKDLKQSTDALKIMIGTKTIPVLTEFQKKLNDITQFLIDTNGPVQDLTISFLAFGGPALSAAAGLAAFGSSLSQIGSVIGFAALGSIGLIIIAVIATGFALYELLTHLKEVRDFLNSDWGRAFQIAMIVMLPFIGIPLMIITNWQRVKDIFVSVMSWIVNNIPQLFGVIIGPFVQAGNLIVQNWRSIIGWFSGVPSLIASYFRALGGLISNAVGNLRGILPAAGQAVMDGFISGLTAGFNKVKDLVGSVASWIKAHKGPLSYDQKLLVPAGEAIMQGFQSGLKSQWSEVQDFIRGIGANIGGGIIAPSLSLSPSGSGQATTNHYGGDTFNIGTINNAQDESLVLRRADRNSQLTGMGIAPVGN